MNYTSCVACKRLIPERQAIFVDKKNPMFSPISFPMANYSTIDGEIYCLDCTKLQIDERGLVEDVKAQQLADKVSA